MNHISAFELPPSDQSASALFALLPGEIRAAICREALSAYEDKARAYGTHTSYRRPDYLAPLKSECALLRSCQRIYQEAWFYPWISSVLTFWLAWQGRRPNECGIEQRAGEFRTALETLHGKHGRVFLDHVRVFSQLCNIGDLGRVLSLPHFYPRVLTVTIRHHDWWSWESDKRLYIDGDICTNFEFPASLREIRMELESLQRKSDQIDWIVDRMVKEWWFKRSDGAVMRASSNDLGVETWRGSSIWEGQRWVRDEIASETLQYYVKTVVWRHDFAARADEMERPGKIQVPESFPESGGVVGWDYIGVEQLRKAGVPDGSSAATALMWVMEWHDWDDSEGEGGGGDDSEDSYLRSMGAR